MDYWEKNGIQKPQSIIVCAAVRQPETGHIVTGARHHGAIMRMALVVNKITSAFEQGFIDQFEDFYNREDALAIVKASGQPFNEDRNGSDTELFSEGLY